jgi:NADH:ubiquinone oxidoreductase subunit 3 (subunit A)
MWRRDRKRTYSILCKILSWLILFVLFDVEVIFLYPWAINFKELGMEGMVKMVIFMVLLLVGFSTSSKESARMGIRNYYKH